MTEARPQNHSGDLNKMLIQPNHIADAGKMVHRSVEYDPLLRPPEAAEYLGISVSGLRKLCAAGKIRKIRLGHRHMAIRLSELNQFVKKSESKPA